MSPNQENVPGVFSCSSASLELVGHEGRQYDHDLYAGEEKEEKGSGVFLEAKKRGRESFLTASRIEMGVGS